MANSISIAAVVSRLSPIAVRAGSIPTFPTASQPTETSWGSWSQSTASETMDDCLANKLANNNIRCIVFGEQHHQPRVLAAQLALVNALATPPFSYNVTILMEHFNLLQQPLLRQFAGDGDIQALQDGYSKSSEGFRLTQAGYFPLLQLARELENVNSEIQAGFPPREWARVLMKEGIDGLKGNADIATSGALEGFDRWQDLQVTKAHSAYIQAMIKGGAQPDLSQEAKQGGLNSAQAFKDAVMAWRADRILEGFQQDGSQKQILVVVCGSGHCDYRFGVPERIRGCKKDELLLMLTKPLDGGFWEDYRERVSSSPEGSALADAVITYEPVDV